MPSPQPVAAATSLRLLLVEDSEDDVLLLLDELRRSGYDPMWERIETASAMKRALDRSEWDLVIADYTMPRFSAPAALALLQQSGLDLPFIVVSGTVGEDVAVACMRAGAHDYLMKDNLTRLVPAVERELREAEVRRARHRAETNLALRAEELSLANAELEQFAFVAAHDLQEPLRMVTSYCDLLQRRYTGRLDPDADDFIGFAVEGANRARALVRDLLAYTLARTDGKPLEPVSCESALERALIGLKEEVAAASARVTHDPLPVVHADGYQLTQLFQNLVGNALKFRSNEPPAIHVGSHRNSEGWQISVADNGIGINVEFSDKVFGVFQRLHKRRDYPGTGVGLAICKKIIERHGGRIWFQSEPDKGSTFYFTIPERQVTYVN